MHSRFGFLAVVLCFGLITLVPHFRVGAQELDNARVKALKSEIETLEKQIALKKAELLWLSEDEGRPGREVISVRELMELISPGPVNDFDTVIERIKANVAPHTWDRVGGRAEIIPFNANKTLVIDNREEVIDNVGEFVGVWTLNLKLGLGPAPGQTPGQ